MAETLAERSARLKEKYNPEAAAAERRLDEQTKAEHRADWDANRGGR